jgi:hypothetical protein
MLFTATSSPTSSLTANASFLPTITPTTINTYCATRVPASMVLYTPSSCSIFYCTASSPVTTNLETNLNYPSVPTLPVIGFSGASLSPTWASLVSSATASETLSAAGDPSGSVQYWSGCGGTGPTTEDQPASQGSCSSFTSTSPSLSTTVGSNVQTTGIFGSAVDACSGTFHLLCACLGWWQ